MSNNIERQQRFQRELNALLLKYNATIQLDGYDENKMVVEFGDSHGDTTHTPTLTYPTNEIYGVEVEPVVKPEKDNWYFMLGYG